MSLLCNPYNIGSNTRKQHLKAVDGIFFLHEQLNVAKLVPVASDANSLSKKKQTPHFAVKGPETLALFPTRHLSEGQRTREHTP